MHLAFRCMAAASRSADAESGSADASQLGGSFGATVVGTVVRTCGLASCLESLYDMLSAAEKRVLVGICKPVGTAVLLRRGLELSDGALCLDCKLLYSGCVDYVDACFDLPVTLHRCVDCGRTLFFFRDGLRTQSFFSLCLFFFSAEAYECWQTTLHAQWTNFALGVYPDDDFVWQ